MNFKEIINVVLAVFKDYRVIVACVFVIFYLAFVSFIVSYKKRPPRPKKKKVEAPPPEKKEGEGEENELTPNSRTV